MCSRGGAPAHAESRTDKRPVPRKACPTLGKRRCRLSHGRCPRPGLAVTPAPTTTPSWKSRFRAACPPCLAVPVCRRARTQGLPVHLLSPAESSHPCPAPRAEPGAERPPSQGLMARPPAPWGRTEPPNPCSEGASQGLRNLLTVTHPLGGHPHLAGASACCAGAGKWCLSWAHSLQGLCRPQTWTLADLVRHQRGLWVPRTVWSPRSLEVSETPSRLGA